MSARLTHLLRRALDDLDMIQERDPSIRSRLEALLHPGLTAVWVYRVAHRLHNRGLRLPAKLLTTLSKIATGGIEIHAGATIGRGFFVDHGTGVVIGETAVIGDNVTVFHQVTLGSVGWWHDRQRRDGARRHPTVGDRVVIGAGATVLGAITIGDDCIVGAHALVLADMPPNSRALAPMARVEPRTRADVRLAPVDLAERRARTSKSNEIPEWAVGW